MPSYIMTVALCMKNYVISNTPRKSIRRQRRKDMPMPKALFNL